MGLFGNTKDLEKRIEELEARQRSLLTEFEELHDKCYRWMQRTNKRVRDEKPEQEQMNLPTGRQARMLARRQRRFSHNGQNEESALG